VDIGAYEYGQMFVFGDVSGDDNISAYDAALIFQNLKGFLTV